ncbi:hypothetical protein PTTG_03809 [Puccinia triticina 1-1 BBBD Race 1]|uniref:DPBB_1 domain-containing protein n=2 Tax=Puccinia triticina TaxID=208348 RepID=A0A0C4ESN0_PUCT1|nr:uncharacterized protein PtA15_5A139 [Puccinia triticina]OAV94594.1 hypothetical protein PTTG_03809 [Puccinia triticina 1-1 BBBD Race 1]WAQ84569.1 hypothetical protein PtA15_5A139 [Puccinia triticina]WAR57913.1 hypothetical protein PtB15_5B143 [Puccinia triticina]
MRSSTITLAVTLALSSSSSVSGMPHYLDLASDVSPSARAPSYLIKRSLFDGQSSDNAPNDLLKRGNEKRKSSYNSSDSDETAGSGDEDDDDDCEESSDSDGAVHDLTEQYYKIGSNATGARASSSSSTQSNSYKFPSGYSSPPEEKKPSVVKSGISKEWSKPEMNPSNVEKPPSHEESSSSTSYSSSSHVHYGESGGKTSNRAGLEGIYHGKATFYSQDGNPGACGATHQDTDYIVAIQSQIYDGGKFCGKTIVVTRKSTGQSINCIAADECPGCPTDHSLDLSEGAFKALGNPDEGLFDISWQVMEEN